MSPKNIINSILIAAGLSLGATLSAQNPYLPLWEYIPDGEPYVFEDPDKPGEYRVYVYGSHDSLKDAYCGREQVVWSAPVNNLSNWRYDGIIFRSDKDANGNALNEGGIGDVLYAPDVTAVKGKNGKVTYYLFPNVQNGERSGLIAKSSRPDGPFTVCNWDKNNPRKTIGVYGFDPAVFVDDDKRVYGYWGFEESYAAEINPVTMCTVKKGCNVIHNLIPGFKQDDKFRFFEASSMRKIEDKYVLIYSRFTREGEFGLPMSNYTLAYAYSDNPLGPFTYGGTLIDGRARGLDAEGKVVPTANPYGNTHGSLCKINGKWWIFYHRQTGTDEFSRQAMVAPVTVKVEKGKKGKVIISEGEYNSEGFRTEGLNPLDKTAAGWACYLINPKGTGQKFPNFFLTGSYVKPTRLDTDSYAGPFNLKQPWCPVVNNTPGSVVGYKYFNFTHTYNAKHVRLKMHIRPENSGTITILVGGPAADRGGKVVGSISVDQGKTEEIIEVQANVDAIAGFKGKQPLYFLFNGSEEGKSVCELYDFQFEI